MKRSATGPSGDLLSLFPPHADLHDEPLFYAVHMIHKLWFKVILHELEYARDSIDSAMFHALHCLRRVHTIERTRIGQVDILETISPGSLALLHPSLHQASGGASTCR